MKHLLKKLSFAGGKGKPKPKPAQLKPPILGTIQLAASYSYAELLDLISDGPIAGLVNENGLILTGKDILQGIYLDDTAVAVSNDEILQQEALGQPVNFANSDAVIGFSKLFQNIQNSDISSNIAPPLNYKIVRDFRSIANYNSRSGDLKTDYWSDESIYTNGTSLTNVDNAFFKNNATGGVVNLWGGVPAWNSSGNLNASNFKKQLLLLFNTYNASTNRYERKYIENIFDKYLQASWRIDQWAAIDNF